MSSSACNALAVNQNSCRRNFIVVYRAANDNRENYFRSIYHRAANDNGENYFKSIFKRAANDNGESSFESFISVDRPANVTGEGYFRRNELSDKRTKEYNDLQTSLEKEFQATYKNDADFQRVNIESFSKGSVIAKFKLFFKTEKKVPLGPLADELKDGKLGDINADPNSLKILRPQEKEQEESSQTEIVVIAVVVVIVAVLVAVACCILFRRKYYYYDLKKKSRKPPEKDPERHTYENPEYCDIPELENNYEGVTKPAPHYEIISPSLPKNHVVPGEGLEAKNHTYEELKAAKPIYQTLTPGVSQEEQQNKPSSQAKARHSVYHNAGFQN
ncbi:uncharacterized protein LOC125559774 [Nematostella vectensis]|uniref:uncharacterized protein LOC125559774 n=1 Tax=Nematostella vectensis TaxID=45351 RepID=UPI002076D7FF|nr:uncharacterized protein LOC125559774 [Nematostella vectensis]